MKPEFSFELSADNRPTGLALDPGIGGSKIRVCFRGFLTDEDGDVFHNALDSISQPHLKEWKVRTGRDEGSITNLLVFIGNGKAIVHINFRVVATMIAKRTLAKGEPVTRDDIADIRALSFEDIEIPRDRAVIYVFSHGWRRFLFFDYVPLLGDELRAKYSIDDSPTCIRDVAPRLHAIALFPELYHSKPEVQANARRRGWFPYIRILGTKYRELLEAIEHGFPIEEVEAKIVDSFDAGYMHKMVESWMTKIEFKASESFYLSGLKNFLEDDYIGSVHVLFPRIEGLMQRLFLDKKGKASQSELVKTLIEKTKEQNPDSCLYMADDFGTFLKEYYFAHFDLKSGKTTLSRHSVGHGVVEENIINRVSSFQAFLILDQIFFYL